MPDVQTKPGILALLAGAGCFVAFEGVAFWVLRWAVSGLGQPDQFQPENTIVSNWLKTSAFLVLHLTLVLAAVLVLNNRLPRRYRGQLMGWFYLSLLAGLGLLWPLFYG